MSKILLIEDNDSIILGLEYLFKEEKFEFEYAKLKKEAIEKIEKENFDIVLIDIGLPDGNGFEVGKYIKEYRKQLPIIFLTANDEEKDVVYGLDLGAEDYITKPFRNRELISRIKNVLRRNGKPDLISCKGVSIDTVQRKVFRDGAEVDLTKLEYSICLNLFSNINKLITREEILNDIWDLAGNFVNDNTLTVYIKRIREKIGDKDGKIIETVRGVGYRVSNDVWFCCLEYILKF